MDDLFGDIPVTVSGEALTPAQAAYSTANAAYRNPGAPGGSPTNPSYVTPTHPAVGRGYEVLPGGDLSDPNAVDNIPSVNLFADVPVLHASTLSQTPAMKAAIAASQRPTFDAADSPDAAAATSPGTLNALNAITFGNMPRIEGAESAGLTGLENFYRKATHKAPLPYGMSEAYAAQYAQDKDQLATYRAEHPRQAFVTGALGAADSPLSMLGGEFIEAAPGAGVARFTNATARSLAVGAAEGGLYGAGEADGGVGAHVTGALKGALKGGVIGLAGYPVGAATGGLVTATANGVRRSIMSPLAAIGDATPNLTPQQADAAQALRLDMANRGVDISLPEAVQQVTNNGTGLGRMLRVLESTRGGETRFSPYFANRQAQVMQAVGNFADGLGAPTDTPSITGQTTQAAAQTALNRVRQTINDRAESFYQQMAGQGDGRLVWNNQMGGYRHIGSPGEVIPEDAYAPLQTNAAYREALDQIRGDNLLNADIAHLPDNNGAVMNEVVKQLDRNEKAYAQTAMNPGGNNYKSLLASGARQLADEIASAHSPAWRAARDIGATGRKIELDPLTAGPVGQLAKLNDVASQSEALYPRIPLAGQPAETADAVGRIEAVAPGSVGDLSRQYLLRQLMASRPQLANGPNPYLGSAFAMKVAGNPLQEQNLQAGIGALPNGQSAAEDLSNILEGLRATGKRQPSGSKTAFNEADLHDMGVPPAAKFLESFSLAEPLEPLAALVKSLNYRRNVRGLSDMMLAPPQRTSDILARAAAMRPNVLPWITVPGLAYPATVPAAITGRTGSSQAAIPTR